MNLLIRNVVYRNSGWEDSLTDLLNNPADQSFYIPFFINFFLLAKYDCSIMY